MKVVLGGETFDYDSSKAPMSEALAIEKAYKRRYVQWQDDLAVGSAEAMCVLAWIIWRRDGRDVAYEDIIEGRVDFDLGEMLTSILESAAAQAEAEAQAQAEPDPTIPGSADPDGTPGTGTVTSGRSRSDSPSGRGKSGSSASKTSKR